MAHEAVNVTRFAYTFSVNVRESVLSITFGTGVSAALMDMLPACEFTRHLMALYKDVAF